MKESDKSLLIYLTNDDINYLTIHNVLFNNILLRLSNTKYSLEALRYILFIILEKHFRKAIRNQKKPADKSYVYTTTTIFKVIGFIMNSKMHIT